MLVDALSACNCSLRSSMKTLHLIIAVPFALIATVALVIGAVAKTKSHALDA